MKLTDIIDEEYADTIESSIKKIQVADDNFTSSLMKTYVDTLLYDETVRETEGYVDIDDFSRHSDLYTFIFNSINKKNSEMKYSSQDITAFSVYLQSIKKEEYYPLQGIILSALINIHFEKTKTKEEYILINSEEYSVNRLGSSIDGAKVKIFGYGGNQLGAYMKNGTITVIGNAGYGVGHEMENGTIIVEGNTLYNCGEMMRGGTIKIKGNCTFSTCFGMQNGKIEILGNAGEKTGIFMIGGTLHVQGKIEEIEKNRSGGEIYEGKEKV